MYAATGGQGAEWEKASASGFRIDPTNPLYGGKRLRPVVDAAPGR